LFFILYHLPAHRQYRYADTYRYDHPVGVPDGMLTRYGDVDRIGRRHLPVEQYIYGYLYLSS
jgi:hypothetical protein